MRLGAVRRPGESYRDVGVKVVKASALPMLLTRKGRRASIGAAFLCPRRHTMKRHITTLCVGGVLALALFGVARAGPFEDAQAADQKGDYATELQILRPLAEQGNALAQLGLGVMYANGQGVPQDYAQAAAWYRRAADQGVPDARTNPGSMYERGHGVPQDYVRAHMLVQLGSVGRIGRLGSRPVGQVSRPCCSQDDVRSDR
jgi:uncharacterized protein